MFVLCGASPLLLAGLPVAAQDAKPAQQPPKGASSGGRDPFFDPTKPKPVPPKKPATTAPKVALKPVKPVKPPPTLIAPPDTQTRINIYKAQKQEHLVQGLTPPKPTTAFLVDELEVAGIFRTPRGYAAMVQAKPIRLSYIV